MKKFVSRFVPLLILCSLLVTLPRINIVKADSTIYIRADGSVEGTDKIQRDGNVYTFTHNIYDSIVVEKDNIVVDGAGYILQGTGADNSKGIYLSHRSNVTIKNIEIKSFYCGIWLDSSSNNNIYENNITNNVVGIFLGMSSNNVFRNNRMVDNEQNLVVFSLGELLYSIHDVDASNTVNGKPMYYLVNRQNMEVPSDAGYVTLVNCTGITVRNLNLANEVQGILLAYTTNSTIVKNIITNNNVSIQLVHSSNNTISGNNMANNHYGIEFDESSNNNIIGNYITNNVNGIYCGGPLPFRKCRNNIIYHNSFVNNTKQVNDILWEIPFGALALNIWDYGYPSGGNYWSDYNGTDLYKGAYQNETGSDGVGDTPYVIDENNQDEYPLMYSWVAPPPLETTPPTISIVSPENKTYTANKVSLTFTVSEPTSWIGYSLDRQAIVAIAGNTTLTGLSQDSHSLTVYARDVAGNTGTSETIYFSIKTEPFPITWIVAAIAIIAAVGTALLIYFVKVKKTTEKTEK